MARPLNQEARERARRRAEAFLGIALGDIEDAHGLPHVYAYVLDKTDGDAKWLYIGRHIGTKADYMGSGRAWVKAIDAHGVHHVHRFLIETCEAPDAFGRCTREQYWLDYGFANAERRAAIFNLARESGGPCLQTPLPRLLARPCCARVHRPEALRGRESRPWACNAY